MLQDVAILFWCQLSIETCQLNVARRGKTLPLVEVSTDLVAQHVSCSELQARLAGSALSGYFVGALWAWGGSG